jgi:molecular chaperone GrpE
MNDKSGEANQIETEDNDQAQQKLAEKKHHQYKKELEEAQEENGRLTNQLLRLAAEFENYKKRTEREKAALIEGANIDLITNLLSVVDDLERTIESSKKNKDYNILSEGIELVQKNFVKILQREGLQKMDTIGSEFDPERHDALLQVEVKDKAPNIIVDEHLKGYEFKNRIIRHAKVLVSK